MQRTSQRQTPHTDVCNPTTDNGELLLTQLTVYIDPTIAGSYMRQSPVLRYLYLVEVG